MVAARGLVIESDGTVVAKPYSKFFGYKQFDNAEFMPQIIRDMCDIKPKDLASGYEVYEKLDGSLAIVTTYKGELLFASSGSVEGEYAKLFRNWIDNNLSIKQKLTLKTIGESHTILLEFVSPRYSIVLNYDKEELILHGAINNHDGSDLSSVWLNAISENTGIRMANSIPCNNLNSLIKNINTHTGIEGFIIRFGNGKRIKLKTDEYVELHHKFSLTTGKVLTKNKVKMILELIENDDIDDVLSTCRINGRDYAASIIEKIVLYDKEFKDKQVEFASLLKSDNFSKKRFFMDQSVSNDDKTLMGFVLKDYGHWRLQGVKLEIILKKLKEEFLDESSNDDWSTR